MTKSSGPSFERVKSIDFFRAVTMVLMIWVNDFHSLVGIPEWLKHMPKDMDAMGFSDIIFPAFLFIIGLAIPFSIEKRAIQESRLQIFRHILIRSGSLLIMGVFLVNLENIQGDAMSISKTIWQVGVVLAFFLIWNIYDQTDKRLVTIFMSVGVILLIILGMTFRGGPESAPSGMQVYWWGILGLLGWAYLACATIYLLIRNRIYLLIGSFAFFLVFSLMAAGGYLEFLKSIREHVWIVGDGAFAALTMAGVVAGVLIRQVHQENQKRRGLISCFLLAIGMFIFGMVTRPAWGISKIGATPSWIGFCTAINLIVFMAIYFVADIRKRPMNWSQLIAPAGYATLTCYLIPYIYYAVVERLSLEAPLFISSGFVGLCKSMVLALLIVVFTGVLGKIGVRLRL